MLEITIMVWGSIIHNSTWDFFGGFVSPDPSGQARACKPRSTRGAVHAGSSGLNPLSPISPTLDDINPALYLKDSLQWVMQDLYQQPVGVA